MLGSCLFEGIEVAIGTSFSRPGKDTVFCDLADPHSIRRVVEDLEPQIIIHSAGETRPDVCEKKKRRAWRVNVESIPYLCQIARQAKIIMFSTDYVFNGERGAYSEEDEPIPINYYGKSKLAAEQALLRAKPDSLVLRVAGLFGWSSTNREFLEGFTGRESIECSKEHISSYTYTGDIVRILPTLWDRSGVIHLVGPECFSREDFARLVCKHLGLATVVRGVAGHIAYSGASRPMNTSLVSSKLRAKMTMTVEALNVLRSRR